MEIDFIFICRLIYDGVIYDKAGKVIQNHLCIDFLSDKILFFTVE